MSKILRLFTVSLLLASIIIVSFAGTVFADKGDGPKRSGDCVCTSSCADGPHYNGGPPW